MTKLKINRQHITTSGVHSHVLFKQSIDQCRMPSKYDMKYNGLFKFKKLYPFDKILYRFQVHLQGDAKRCYYTNKYDFSSFVQTKCNSR